MKKQKSRAPYGTSARKSGPLPPTNTFFQGQKPTPPRFKDQQKSTTWRSFQFFFFALQVKRRQKNAASHFTPGFSVMPSPFAAQFKTNGEKPKRQKENRSPPPLYCITTTGSLRCSAKAEVLWRPRAVLVGTPHSCPSGHRFLPP